MIRPGKELFQDNPEKAGWRCGRGILRQSLRSIRQLSHLAEPDGQLTGALAKPASPRGAFFQLHEESAVCEFPTEPPSSNPVSVHSFRLPYLRRHRKFPIGPASSSPVSVCRFRLPFRKTLLRRSSRSHSMSGEREPFRLYRGLRNSFQLPGQLRRSIRRRPDRPYRIQ